jgi:hypothetical protein
MAEESFVDRAGRAYGAARENHYVQRLVEDEELRASLIGAVAAARKAYDRFSDNPSFECATNDRKVQRELQNAAESLRDATERFREPQRKSHVVRNVLALGLLTGGLVLVFSETARKSLLDAIFGEEEEFVYTSATSAQAQTNGTPVAEAPASE